MQREATAFTWVNDTAHLLRRFSSRASLASNSLLVIVLLICAAPATVRASDSDGDDLSDAIEVFIGTNPALIDTDGDGLGDGAEFASGGFPVEHAIQSALWFKRAHVVDVDGDGDPDIVGDDGDVLGWIENLDGAGTYGPLHAVHDSYWGVSDSDVADVDGDGDLDLLVGTNDARKAAWYENVDGQGSFVSQPPIWLSTTGDLGQSLVPVDIDGDGDLDVVVASNSANLLSWYENTDGEGTFTLGAHIPTSLDIVYIPDAGDLDGDGDPDLVIRIAGASDYWAWAENLGGSFAAPQTIPGSTSILYGGVFDWGDDGDLDLLLTESELRELWLFEHAVTGPFDGPTTILANGERPDHVLVADMDGDEDGDLLVAFNAFLPYPSKDPIRLYRNTDGAGTLSPPLLVASTRSIGGVLGAADVDGDGDVDVVGIPSASGNLAWYEKIPASDPLLADTDGDGLNDAVELNTHGTDPRLADTDDDGLGDADELNMHGTDPIDRDTDGDGAFDGQEIAAGSDPLDPLSLPPPLPVLDSAGGRIVLSACLLTIAWITSGWQWRTRGAARS